MQPDGGDNAARAPSAERLRAFLDQVLLRLWNTSPGLACYKESDRVVPEKGMIEISFFKLPIEVLDGVGAAFGLPSVERMAYTKQGHACTGFRAKPSAEDLSALAVDDAADHESQDRSLDVSSPDDLVPEPGQDQPNRLG
jgi:hypothetical protein